MLRQIEANARPKTAAECAHAALLRGVLACVGYFLALAAADVRANESFWTQDVWSDPERPFLFYGNATQQPQEAKRQRDQTLEPKEKNDSSRDLDKKAQGLEAIETLEGLQAEVKKRLDRAVMQPTAQNMTAYLEANAFLIEKAGRFAESWRNALLQAPHFDWTAQHPTVNFASTELSRLAARKVEEQARALKDDWGFIFFGDDSELTRMMLPLVESFSERHGFNTVYVSMIDDNPLMPQARRDRGQASVMAGGIRLFPALVLVRRGDKDPRQARLVATGVVDLAELARRVVRLAGSEDFPHGQEPMKSAEGFAQGKKSLLMHSKATLERFDKKSFGLQDSGANAAKRVGELGKETMNARF